MQASPSVRRSGGDPGSRHHHHRQLTVNDIPTADFLPVTSTKLSVPKLSDTRAIDLGAAFSKFLAAPSNEFLARSCRSPAGHLAGQWTPPCVETIDEGLMDLLLQNVAKSKQGDKLAALLQSVSSGSPSTATAAGRKLRNKMLRGGQLISARASEELFLQIHAYYKLSHEEAIRVHDELAVNTGVNIAEYFLLEQGFSRSFCKLFSQFKRLPSIGLFLLRLLVTEGSVLSTALAPRELPSADVLRQEAFYASGIPQEQQGQRWGPSSTSSTSTHHHHETPATTTSTTSTSTAAPSVSLLDQRRRDNVMEKLRSFVAAQQQQREAAEEREKYGGSTATSAAQAERAAQAEADKRFKETTEAQVSWDWDKACTARNREQIARWSGCISVMLATIQKFLPVQLDDDLVSNMRGGGGSGVFGEGGSQLHRSGSSSLGGRRGSFNNNSSNNLAGTPAAGRRQSMRAGGGGGAGAGSGGPNSQIPPEHFEVVHLLHKMEFRTGAQARDAFENCCSGLSVGSKILLPPLMRFEGKDPMAIAAEMMRNAAAGGGGDSSMMASPSSSSQGGGGSKQTDRANKKDSTTTPHHIRRMQRKQSLTGSGVLVDLGLEKLVRTDGLPPGSGNARSQWSRTTREEVKHATASFDYNASDAARTVNVYVECSMNHAFSLKPFCSDLRTAKAKARAAQRGGADVSAAFHLLQKMAGLSRKKSRAAASMIFNSNQQKAAAAAAAAAKGENSNNNKDESPEDDEEDEQQHEDPFGAFGESTTSPLFGLNDDEDEEDEDKFFSDDEDNDHNRQHHDDDDEEGEDEEEDEEDDNNNNNENLLVVTPPPSNSTNPVVVQGAAVVARSPPDAAAATSPNSAFQPFLSPSQISIPFTTSGSGVSLLSVTSTQAGGGGNNDSSINRDLSSNLAVSDDSAGIMMMVRAASAVSREDSNAALTPSAAAAGGGGPARRSRKVSFINEEEEQRKQLEEVKSGNNNSSSSSSTSSDGEDNNNNNNNAKPSPFTLLPKPLSESKLRAMDADASCGMTSPTSPSSSLNILSPSGSPSSASNQQQHASIVLPSSPPASSSTSATAATSATSSGVTSPTSKSGGAACNNNTEQQQQRQHPDVDLFLLRPFVTAEYLGYDAETNRINFRITPDLRPKKNVEKFCGDVMEGVVEGEEHAETMFNRLATRFLKAHCCPKHRALQLTHYCSACDIFVCESCIVETHPGHDVVPRSAYCTQKIAALQPMKEMFEKRIALLQSLKGQVESSQARLLESVDTAMADSRKVLEARKASLKNDAVERGRRMIHLVDSEVERNEVDRQKAREAMHIVQEQQRRGILRFAPFVELHIPATIRNELDLLLPTKVVTTVVQSLDWSLTAKHLTQVVYPSPEEIAEEEKKAKQNASVPISKEKSLSAVERLQKR